MISNIRKNLIKDVKHFYNQYNKTVLREIKKALKTGYVALAGWNMQHCSLCQFTTESQLTCNPHENASGVFV
jgi:hypothetical protein